jgi:hypothetical protein
MIKQAPTGPTKSPTAGRKPSPSSSSLPPAPVDPATAAALADDALPEMQLPKLSAATERHRYRRRVMRYAQSQLAQAAAATAAKGDGGGGGV